MDFFGAVRVCFAKYFDFSGRAGRAEFWYFALFCLLGNIVALVMGQVFYVLFSLGVFIPNLTVTVRRLHDIGRPGWWLVGIFLIGFLAVAVQLGGTVTPSPSTTASVFIIAAIYALYILWFVQPGDPGENRYGAAPAH